MRISGSRFGIRASAGNIKGTCHQDPVRETQGKTFTEHDNDSV